MHRLCVCMLLRLATDGIRENDGNEKSSFEFLGFISFATKESIHVVDKYVKHFTHT